MKIKKLFLFISVSILALCLAASLTATSMTAAYLPEGGNLPSGDISAPDMALSARAAVLTDGAGRVLMAKNADMRLPMASTTKLMTALVAIESLPLQTVIRIPAAAVGIEGSSIYLTEGEELTLEALLYALMLESANDAATAIAIAVAGSADSFAELMNERAAALGLKDTHFDNPHGLDSDTHYTTARELAAIAAAAFDNTELRRISGTYRKTIPMGDNDGARLLINHDRLLRSYEGTIGGKTGFTKKSGRCLVTAAERDGLRLIAVTLSDPDDWQDHERMLDYGFSKYESVELCRARECRFLLSLSGGEQRGVIGSNTQAVRVTLPRQREEVTISPSLPASIQAPVRRGEPLGTVSWVCGGRVIATADVTAEYSAMAKKQRTPSLIERIRSILGF